jgi:hypothetical protein
VWHLLEQREVRRLARGRAAATPGPLPRPARPAGTDLLPQIRHIVVLMMENHSYDNYLGMLQGRGEGFPLGPDGEPEVVNRGTGGEVVRAFHLPSTAQRRGVPSQSWHASHLQWGEGRCDGFVTSAQNVQAEARAGAAADDVDTAAEAAAMGMGYWSERDLPVTVRAAGLRLLRGPRPHLGTQAGRGEMEPARAHRAGRSGQYAIGCAGLRQRSRLPQATVLPEPSLEWGSW